MGPVAFAMHDHIHHRIDKVRLVAFTRVIRQTALTAVWMTVVAHWILLPPPLLPLLVIKERVERERVRESE